MPVISAPLEDKAYLDSFGNSLGILLDSDGIPSGIGIAFGTSYGPSIYLIYGSSR
jgi:hypothetical protein